MDVVGAPSIVVIAPRYRSDVLGALTARFGSVPGVSVIEDRRKARNRRLQKAMRHIDRRRRADRRLFPSPEGRRFVGVVGEVA